MAIQFVTTQKAFVLADEKGKYEFAGSLSYSTEWKTWSIHINLSHYDALSEKEALLLLRESIEHLSQELAEAIKGL